MPKEDAPNKKAGSSKSKDAASKASTKDEEEDDDAGSEPVELEAVKSKKGELYAQGALEDMVGSVDVLVFPEAYRRLHEKLKLDVPVLIRGSVRVEEGANPKLLLSEITPLEQELLDIRMAKSAIKYKEVEGTNKVLDEAGISTCSECMPRAWQVFTFPRT